MRIPADFERNRRRLRVLVADDDPTIVDALTSILDHAGFDTVGERHAVHARAHLLDEPFDLVLTDLYFDEQPAGYEIALAARGARPQVPVVMLTARPSFGGACEALRSQVAEIVVKPIDPTGLIEICHRAIRNASVDRRNRELEARNRILARVVPRMVEAKDVTTSGHSERVVGYGETLGRLCGVSAADRESLRLACLLHDVGKIGIPSAILCKPGPLDRAEREIIERHPDIGREILADLEDSESVRAWVHQHHEKWDGTGYPQGLAGDEVALPGRILVLAEVYDALIEERSYKPAWPVAKIVAFFRAQAGRHFDPDLAHLVADGLERDGPGFFDVPAEPAGVLESSPPLAPR